jgi:Peptidase propeptide and YPEB domain
MILPYDLAFVVATGKEASAPCAQPSVPSGAFRKVTAMRLIPTVFAISLGFAVPAAAAPVNIDDVRDMAFGKGMVKIDEVKLDHRGVWKVEGEDASGHEIEMKVDAASGAIIKLKRDD